MKFALLALAIAIASTACTSKSDSPSPEILPTKTADKSAVDEAKKKADDLRDLTSGGGQPGAVSIAGPLADEVGVSDSHIRVQQTPGSSWRQTIPKLDEKSLIKNKSLADSDLKEIAEAKAIKKIVYVGCEDLMDTTSIIRPADLESVVFQAVPTDAVTMIEANTVFICGAAALPNRLTMIVAEKVYLSGLRLELSGGPGNGISITTSDLIFTSLNFITTKAPSGPTTLLAGPSVSISALHIGDTHGGESRIGQEDRIEIKSYGADYQEKAKP